MNTDNFSRSPAALNSISNNDSLFLPVVSTDQLYDQYRNLYIKWRIRAEKCFVTRNVVTGNKLVIKGPTTSDSNAYEMKNDGQLIMLDIDSSGDHVGQALYFEPILPLIEQLCFGKKCVLLERSASGGIHVVAYVNRQPNRVEYEKLTFKNVVFEFKAALLSYPTTGMKAIVVPHETGFIQNVDTFFISLMYIFEGMCCDVLGDVLPVDQFQLNLNETQIKNTISKYFNHTTMDNISTQPTAYIDFENKNEMSRQPHPQNINISSQTPRENTLTCYPTAKRQSLPEKNLSAASKPPNPTKRARLNDDDNNHSPQSPHQKTSIYDATHTSDETFDGESFCDVELDNIDDNDADDDDDVSDNITYNAPQSRQSQHFAGGADKQQPNKTRQTGAVAPRKKNSEIDKLMERDPRLTRALNIHLIEQGETIDDADHDDSTYLSLTYFPKLTQSILFDISEIYNQTIPRFSTLSTAAHQYTNRIKMILNIIEKHWNPLRRIYHIDVEQFLLRLCDTQYPPDSALCSNVTFGKLADSTLWNKWTTDYCRLHRAMESQNMSDRGSTSNTGTQNMDSRTVNEPYIMYRRITINNAKGSLLSEFVAKQEYDKLRKLSMDDLGSNSTTSLFITFVQTTMLAIHHNQYTVGVLEIYASLIFANKVDQLNAEDFFKYRMRKFNYKINSLPDTIRQSKIVPNVFLCVDRHPWIDVSSKIFKNFMSRLYPNTPQGCEALLGIIAKSENNDGQNDMLKKWFNMLPYQNGILDFDSLVNCLPPQPKLTRLELLNQLDTVYDEDAELKYEDGVCFANIYKTFFFFDFYIFFAFYIFFFSITF